MSAAKPLNNERKKIRNCHQSSRIACVFAEWKHSWFGWRGLFWEAATMVCENHQYSSLLLGKADFLEIPAESFFASIIWELNEFFCARAWWISYVGHVYWNRWLRCSIRRSVTGWNVPVAKNTILPSMLNYADASTIVFQNWLLFRCVRSVVSLSMRARIFGLFNPGLI